eukprot:Mrub_08942.p1 GENE.Mrub_08942~~Mrub_08942.p1  ORF type:complete len:254 (+),score=46.69 Mrub_08942:26-787(+)
MSQNRKIILLRHGQSIWNMSNTFTGWTDIPISNTGRKEAMWAAYQMIKAAVIPTQVHTSILSRTVQTFDAMSEVAEWTHLPVKKHWQLNERSYGALQGHNKDYIQELYGEEKSKTWRKSYAGVPPNLCKTDERHPVNNSRLFSAIHPNQLPASESLQMVVDRLNYCYYEEIIPQLSRHELPLIVGHAHSIRGLVKIIKGLDEQQVQDMECIPNCVPIVVELDKTFNYVQDYQLGSKDELNHFINKESYKREFL